MSPGVSVCVSTFSRRAMLERLFHALAAQDLDLGFEVCVCDNGSSDGTGSLLAEWEGRLDLRSVRLEANQGPAGGRNAAWRLAGGDLVVFTDDDCIPTPGWLRAHVDGHARASGPLVAVGAVQPIPAELGREGSFSRTVRVTDALYFQTCNSSYPRSLLEAAGGFDETFRTPAGEDTDLGLRCLELGARRGFLPDALVHHGVRASDLRATLRETLRWADIPLVFAKHPEARQDLLHRRWFWKRSHPVTILALVGLVAAPRRPWLVLLVVPWVRFRRQVWPVRVPRRRMTVPVLAGQLVVDAAEVATMVRGSVRHRALVL
jgi:glycosyltransferase involved in cell wall biosynthesis